MKKTSLRTEIRTILDDDLITSWKALWEKSEHANIFNSYEWVNSYLKISKNKEIEYHVCFDNDRLVGILPLQQYSLYGVRMWGVLCKERHGYTPFLMENYSKELFSHFFGTIFSKRTVFLQKNDSDAAELLHKLYPKLLISLMSVNPFIPLTDNLFADTSGSLVKQVKHLLKKYDGKIQLKFFHTDLDKHFKDILELQKYTSKTAKSMDIFQDSETKKYYQNLIHNCGSFVRIGFLYFEDTPIAYEYGLMYKHSYFGEQIAFHSEFKKYIPGKVLLFQLVDELQKQGITRIDMGGGISNYKMQFTKDYSILYNIYHSNNPFIMLWLRMTNKLRRLKQVLFPKKFTRDHEFLFKTL